MHRRISIVLSLLASASAAFGQVIHTPLYTLNGPTPSAQFGVSVSGAGDVNNDGVDDFIIGAARAGSAHVYSGVDGGTLHTFYGDSATDRFGFAVSGAGDVNGDGYDDLIVGAEGDDNNGFDSGSARVFSGLDGSILYTFDGDSALDWFGYAVSGAGDVNNDGFHDLIVGAVADDNNGASSGSARVFSGFDGSTLYTFNGDSLHDQFGVSVSGVGDINGDGFDDVIVGAWGADTKSGQSSGNARVFSGFDGSILYTFDGDSAGDIFGRSVSGAGDVNNDGVDDFIVGAPFDDNNGVDAGSARVFSGADGSVLSTVYGDSANDQFGTSVGDAGDVNGDGFDDLIVGSPYDDTNGDTSGSTRVFSGFDGSVLYTFNGDSAGDGFGWAVSGAGDINKDGFADFIVGADAADNNDENSGSVFVFVSMAPATPCPADANGDNIVNFADLNAVLADFGQSGEDLAGDINGDGAADFADLNEVLAAFGTPCE